MGMTLTEQETRVLVLRNGYDETRPRTLEETGRAMGGITRERVRQIEAGMIAKLRRALDDAPSRIPDSEHVGPRRYRRGRAQGVKA